MSERPASIQPKDDLLDHLLNTFPNKVFKYLEHESLLGNKNEEDMTEDEKQEALVLHNANKTKNTMIAAENAGIYMHFERSQFVI